MQLLDPRVTAIQVRGHLTHQMRFPLTISCLPTQLQERGVYKAMSEFDIFINYIEAYMTMKMKD